MQLISIILVDGFFFIHIDHVVDNNKYFNRAECIKQGQP